MKGIILAGGSGTRFSKKFPQGQLIRVINGIIFDVAVDYRANSRTKGK